MRIMSMTSNAEPPAREWGPRFGVLRICLFWQHHVLLSPERHYLIKKGPRETHSYLEIGSQK